MKLKNLAQNYKWQCHCFSDFPKDYKRHEKRRDEENRMKEELSKYKTDESRQQNPSKLGDL